MFNSSNRNIDYSKTCFHNLIVQKHDPYDIEKSGMLF